MTNFKEFRDYSSVSLGKTEGISLLWERQITLHLQPFASNESISRKKEIEWERHNIQSQHLGLQSKSVSITKRTLTTNMTFLCLTFLICKKANNKSNTQLLYYFRSKKFIHGNYLAQCVEKYKWSIKIATSTINICSPDFLM